MSKIYTRVGDGGETSLLGGQKVRKDDVRVDAMGAVDELNAAIGLVRMELSRSGIAPPDVDTLLAQQQHRLFDLGAELAASGPAPRGTQLVSDAHISALESAIDRFDGPLEPLREFILPGGVPAAAQVHFARCVCRRAERQLVHLAGLEPVRGELLRYLNRLSDLLFVLARAINSAHGAPDITWRQGT